MNKISYKDKQNMRFNVASRLNVVVGPKNQS